MKPYITLLRPRHWIKNLFLFIPIFFAGHFFDTEKIVEVLLGFVAFSIIASGVYVLNDVKDYKEDRLHQFKKFRPIASGEVSISKAVVLCILLFVTGSFLSYTLDFQFFIFIGLYFAINLTYSFGLKNIPILDLFFVASGFIIRVLSGGELANVEISQWLIIMVMLLSLFLVLGKRMDDLVLSENKLNIRKSSSKYSIEFVQSCLTMLSAIAVVAYLMYTLSDDVTNRLGTNHLYLTSAFVIAGVMRYLQIAIVEKDSGSPTDTLFKDKFIIVTLTLWILSFFLIIY
ncbi:MAG: decaprenyl-phosphate phosphoribosyltransferase [Bacteroidota bacterium]